MLAASGFRFKGPDKAFDLRSIGRTLATMARRSDLELVEPSSGSKPALYLLSPHLRRSIERGDPS